MAVKQDSMSIEDLDRESVCAGCEHSPDEGEELHPVVLNPRLESEDTPNLAVDRTQETIEFDPDDLQSFLDQYTDREVAVVADYIFWMHSGCIESLFDVDVESVEDGVMVSEREVSSEEPSEDDSRTRASMSKPEVVTSWIGLTVTLIFADLLSKGLVPDMVGFMGMVAALSILVHLWPSSAPRGGL